VIRRYRDQHFTQSWLRTMTNFSPDDYLKVLANASCAVGNSSSFVRDASYFGTPVVLVGDRQAGRERGAHVTPVRPVQEEISRAIQSQLAHGRYAPSALYGDGHVSPRVANSVATLHLYSQKQLSYVQNEDPIAA
jgi:UDP-N-acetylglucosamine 2-epimerase